jgi:hypothetical protein
MRQASSPRATCWNKDEEHGGWESSSDDFTWSYHTAEELEEHPYSTVSPTPGKRVIFPAGCTTILIIML